MRFLKFAIALLFCFSFQFSNAQTQLKGWYMPPFLLDMQSPTPVKKPNFTTNPASTGAVNGVYDNAGKLLFYLSVDNTNKRAYFYNKFNQEIGSFSTSCEDRSSPVVAIVPFFGNNDCQAKYHVFLNYQYRTECCMRMALARLTLDMYLNDGQGDFVRNYPQGPISVQEVLGGPVSVSFAISKPISADSRYLFVNNYGRITRFDLTNSGTSNEIALFQAPVSGLSRETELSSDGKKLAWAFTNEDKMNVIELSNGQYVANSHKTFNLIGNSTGKPKYLEFNNAGDALLVSVGGGKNLNFINLSTNAVSAIANTTAYGASQLEKGFNGNYIFASSVNGLAGFNPTTGSIDLSTSINNVAVPSTIDMGDTTRFLPFQIDGENYETQTVKIPDLITYNVPTGSINWTPASNPFININPNANLTTETSHQKIIVGKAINIPNGSILTTTNMVIEYFTNAEMNINAGGRLNVAGSLYQGALCNKMWRGIKVNDNNGTLASNLTLYKNGTQVSAIFDAIKGVELIGVNAKINSSEVLYAKNEKHIVINQGISTNIYEGNGFYHTLPLKDQSYGVAIGSQKYGITSIEINNTLNAQNIGNATVGNYFESGQYGINAIKSNFSVNKGEFKDIKNIAVLANGQSGNYQAEINNASLFTNCLNGVVFDLGISGVVQASTFNNTGQYAVYVKYNQFSGNKVTIGGIDATKGNTFDGFGWSAISLQNNLNPNFEANIQFNTFKNAYWADAIYISETNLPSSGTSFNKMFVRDNTSSNIGRGINLINFKGNADKEHDGTSNLNFEINKNTIDFVTTQAATQSGIKAQNIQGVRIFDNTVSTPSNTSWENTGIDVMDAQNCMVYNNTIKAGAGIRSRLNNLGSNIYCNKLNENVVGIDLNWEILRDVGQTHGSSARGRQNYFTGTQSWGCDYYCYNSDVTRNQWVSPNGVIYQYTGATNGTNFVSAITGPTSCSGPTFLVSYNENQADLKRINSLPQAIQLMVADSAEQQEFGQYLKWRVLWETTELVDAKQQQGLTIVTDFNELEKLKKLHRDFCSGDSLRVRTKMTGIKPNNKYEANLLKAISIVSICRNQQNRQPDEFEKAELIQIASESARKAGPAAYIARAVLKNHFNLDFEEPTFYDPNHRMMLKNSGAGQKPKTVSIYPNPASDVLQVEVQNQANMQYLVYNNMGQVVLKGALKSSQTFIELSALAPGMYSIQLWSVDGAEKSVHTFVKQ